MNFGNVIVEILRKKFCKRGERHDVSERKKKLNCGNTITVIMREKKFTIVAIQLSKYERNSKKRNLEFQ